jgi:hypothetical protein
MLLERLACNGRVYALSTAAAASRHMRSIATQLHAQVLTLFFFALDNRSHNKFMGIIGPEYRSS